MPVARLRPHPVHARSDAQRHHRHRRDVRRPSQRDRSFKFLNGPIFANVLLADEINRTPPKTQAALLEGMQSAGLRRRETLPAADPFFVLATQNHRAGSTYPLPEAQLDRFLMKVYIHYPDLEDEKQIYR